MKTKSVFLFSVSILCSLYTFSQNDIDAMRYSQLTFGGTARFNAMAGSMGALGGDISTLSFNPAGIGVFRKSEITISPSVFYQKTSSIYRDVNSTDDNLNFNLGNIGLVATFKLRDTSSGWHSFNFGFGYNKTNNFHNRILTQAVNKYGSLLDTYIADADGQYAGNAQFDAFSTDLAYQTYLINPLTPDSIHYSHVIPYYGEEQRKSVETRGSMGETDISFGGNYRDRVFIGASIGIVNARYIEENNYSETDVKDTIVGFKSFTLKQNLDTKGNGVNFKMGVIVKATDWLRFGAAVHTPTRFSMNDLYSNRMSSNLDGKQYSWDSPNGSFNYKVSTPFRALGSIGFIINKLALLNVEYEFVNYKNASLSSSPNVFSDINTYIRNNYTSNNNLRIGTEVRFDPFCFRAGYALYGSPFKNGLNRNANRTSYTAGVGFRKDIFFVDFAFVLTSYTDYSYLYSSSFNNAVVKNTYTSNNYVLTAGIRF